MDKEELDRIISELTADKKKSREITPRELFSAFGFQRRTYYNCVTIEQYLAKHHMELFPSYNDVWIDTPVTMRHKQVASSAIENPIKKIRSSSHLVGC